MINGQINAASMLTVTQPVTPEATLPVAVMTDGVPQSGGNFAETLSGIQSLAKLTALSDSGQAEQLPLETGAENLVVDLLAGLSVLPLETVETKVAEVAEKTEVSDATAMQGSDSTALASQMAMVLSAYAQPDRMPDVNNLTTQPDDTLQKVAVVSEQPAVISAPPILKRSGQVPLELQPPAAENASQQVKSDRMSDVNKLTTLSADTLQKVAVVLEQSVVISAPPVMKQPEEVPVELKSSATENQLQQVKSDRMSDLNKLKIAAASEKSEIISASPEKTKAEQIVLEPAKAPVILPPITAAIAVPDETIVPQDANQHANEKLSAPLTASAPTPSLESELEIQLSQPQPITARITTAAVLAENRSAALVQGQRTALKQLNPEQQIEKVRTANDPSNAKEVAPLLKNAESASESTLGSGTSQGGEGNQGQSGSTSDNQTLAQNMSTQLGSEHQKVSSLSTKAAFVEPVRQDVPEQVMQQVKERLVQHDVKPGSQQITLTLSPDSLGELKMNLNLQGQKLSVEIVTENRSVRDIIVQHTDALKESLARQNITMESFDVTTGGKGSGNQGQNQNAWRELAKQQQQQQSWASPYGYQVTKADFPSGQAAYQRQQGQSMLDIHY